ncbi:hypothetical protein SNEBB_004843 [Seison nebaliae]|nr:hypothetical protein SNEBB_004843 [Seison nebaliae]
MPFTWVKPEKCPKCSKTVYKAEGVNILGRLTHRFCVKCAECNKLLEIGKFVDHNDNIYCRTCYSRSYGPAGVSAGIVYGRSDETEIKENVPNKSPIYTARIDDKPKIQNHYTINNNYRFQPNRSTIQAQHPTEIQRVQNSKARIISSFQQAQRNICPRCNKVVYLAEQIVAINKTWHKLCLKCKSCNRSLTCGDFCDKDNEIFCKVCYRRSWGPKGVGVGIGAGILSTECL